MADLDPLPDPLFGRQGDAGRPQVGGRGAYAIQESHRIHRGGPGGRPGGQGGTGLDALDVGTDRLVNLGGDALAAAPTELRPTGGAGA